MATIITSDSLEKHHVGKYNFKVLSQAKTKESTLCQQNEAAVAAPSQSASSQESEVDASALSSSSKDSLIESLMKKTDEMSSNFIKLQMRLEQKEEEFEQKLKEAKEQAFAEGMQAGQAKAKAEIEATLGEKMQLCVKSIETLEASSQEFAKGLEALKSELVGAALDVAQEVIRIEVSQNSAHIAEVLAKELINDLQGASKIVVKVNPKDHAYLSEHLKNLANVQVKAESAVREGGVIVMSDVGNIDAEIHKRFENVKRVALSE